ncbi:MAG: hypothetical protein KKD44_25305 [Proteobacteria bacterium]|nr:hypothetical protein [Pseudomonadota bacterium]
MNKLRSIPQRLTIGITGHRHLDDESRIKDVVCTLVDTIKSTYKGNERTSIELCVLSALAEGADRIVADEVLNSDPNAVLKVMLPLVEAEYLEDFETQSSKEQFERLIQKSRNPASLRNRPLKDDYPEAMLVDARRQLYEDVGHFIVDHCDILVAVWDGKPARGIGGTARIVEYARQTDCPVYIINAHEPELKPFDIDLNFDALYSKIDTWNSHCATPAKKEDKRGDYGENVFNSLFPDGTNPETLLSDQKETTLKQFLIPHYTTASRLAKNYQAWYKRMGNSIFWIAFAAVAGVALAVIFLREHEWFFLAAFGLELIFMIMIVGIVVYDRRTGHFHKNWTECRFLAERIRTAFYNCICSMEGLPVFIPRRVQGEMLENRWMDFVFDEVLSQSPEISRGDIQKINAFANYIQTAWIDEQINYHREKIESCNKSYHRLEKWCERVFYMALLAAFFHLVAHFFHNHLVDHILTLAALILPALAATLEGIRSIREYKRLAIRSQQMERRLINLKKEFHVMTPEKLERIIGKMEKLMLEESEDWLSFMSPAELYKVA